MASSNSARSLECPASDEAFMSFGLVLVPWPRRLTAKVSRPLLARYGMNCSCCQCSNQLQNLDHLWSRHRVTGQRSSVSKTTRTGSWGVKELAYPSLAITCQHLHRAGNSQHTQGARTLAVEAFPQETYHAPWYDPWTRRSGANLVSCCIDCLLNTVLPQSTTYGLMQQLTDRPVPELHGATPALPRRQE